MEWDQRRTSYQSSTHLVRRCTNKFLHLLHKLVADIEVQYPQEDKKRCRDRGSNNASDIAKGVKPVTDGRGRGSDYDRGNDNDTSMGIEILDRKTGHNGSAWKEKGAPAAKKIPRAYVEWPREKKVPTVTGR